MMVSKKPSAFTLLKEKKLAGKYLLDKILRNFLFPFKFMSKTFNTSFLKKPL